MDASLLANTGCGGFCLTQKGEGMQDRIAVYVSVVPPDFV